MVCAYLNEHEDAKDTKQWVERAGRRCVLVASDLSDEAGCRKVIQVARDQMGVGSDRPLDILVNNAAFQGKAVDDFQEITYDRVLHTFKTNIISMFELTRLALPLFHDKAGGSIINVGSIQAFHPGATIADYAATKGAIVNFTKSMAPKLMERVRLLVCDLVASYLTFWCLCILSCCAACVGHSRKLHRSWTHLDSIGCFFVFEREDREVWREVPCWSACNAR